MKLSLILPLLSSLNIPRTATEGGPAPKACPAPEPHEPTSALFCLVLSPFIFDICWGFGFTGGIEAMPSMGGGGIGGPVCLPCCCPISHFCRALHNEKKGNWQSEESLFSTFIFWVFLWISVSLQMKSKRQIIHSALWRFDEFYSLVVKITWIRVLKIVFSRKIGTTNSAWRIAAEPVGGV